MGIYKRALQGHFVYKTTRGYITTEDLLNLPLKGNNGFNLNEVASCIAQDIEKEGKLSFVDENTSNPINAAKMEIVKDVIADKIAEKKAKLEEKTKADKRREILEILSKKRSETLGAKSEEELLKELQALDA